MAKQHQVRNPVSCPLCVPRLLQLGNYISTGRPDVSCCPAAWHVEGIACAYTRGSFHANNMHTYLYSCTCMHACNIYIYIYSYIYIYIHMHHRDRSMFTRCTLRTSPDFRITDRRRFLAWSGSRGAHRAAVAALALRARIRLGRCCLSQGTTGRLTGGPLKERIRWGTRIQLCQLI